MAVVTTALRHSWLCFPLLYDRDAQQLEDVTIDSLQPVESAFGFMPAHQLVHNSCTRCSGLSSCNCEWQLYVVPPVVLL